MIFLFLICRVSGAHLRVRYCLENNVFVQVQISDGENWRQMGLSQLLVHITPRHRLDKVKCSFLRVWARKVDLMIALCSKLVSAEPFTWGKLFFGPDLTIFQNQKSPCFPNFYRLELDLLLAPIILQPWSGNGFLSSVDVSCVHIMFQYFVKEWEKMDRQR